MSKRKRIAKENTSKINPSWIVYIIGISVLAIWYYEIKTFFGGEIWFILVVVTYLLFLRLLGYFIAKKKYKKNKKNIIQFISILILLSMLILFFSGYILGPDRIWIK